MKLIARLTAILSFLVMFQYANAASNLIIVDQIGSSSTIDLTQTGLGNSIGDATNHAIINGNSNAITIDQIGNNNTAAYSVDGNGNTLSHTFTGNYNQLSLLCVTCSAITMTDVINGNSNIIHRNFDTTASTSTINIQSDNNDVTINNDTSAIAGAHSSVDISGGNGNIVQIRQTGAASTNGHDATLTIVGATNTVNIDQGGVVDSNVHATINGSGNTMHINSNY